MKRFLLFSFFSIGLLFFSTSAVLGQTGDGGSSLQEDVLKQLGTTAEKAELSNDDPRLIIAETIQLLLSLVGMVFIVLIILAGYWRFTAHGEEEKIQKSNKTILGAVIGLVIIFISYATTEFIVRRVQNAVQEEQIYDTSDQGPPQDQWAIPLF